MNQTIFQGWCTKQRVALLVFCAVCAAVLGVVSLWDNPSTLFLFQGLMRTVFLFVILVLFLGLIPLYMSLPLQIMVAMIAGVLIGWIGIHIDAEKFILEYLAIFGKLFILLLTLVIIPLIFVSVLNGTACIGNPRDLGTLGLKSLVYYIATTSVAVLIGLALVNILQPGRGREFLRHDTKQTSYQDLKEESQSGQEKSIGTLSSQREVSLGRRLQEQILPLIIRNPIMPGQSPIPVIFLAILLGAALAALGEEGGPALRVFHSLDKAFITIILWVMHLAPLGVLALMAKAISELGIEYMLTLMKYFCTTLAGLVIHFVLLCCGIVPLFGGISALTFLRGMAPAFQLAFSTSSSSATLPVTIECLTKRLGADSGISGFMLPVGATINMDGTALYLTVASVFIAQVYGIELTLQQQFLVFLTAIVASIGTAGIPGASAGLIGIILSSMNIPVEGLAIVLGVDRLLDMSRTVVNVAGDSVGVVIISRSEGKPLR